MIDDSRRRFLIKSSVGASAAIFTSAAYSSREIKENVNTLESEHYISEQWCQLHSISPQQYMRQRIKSDKLENDFRGFIVEDFKNNNICFVGGITMSVFEFALLAAKH
jgi:hypothetical protein